MTLNQTMVSYSRFMMHHIINDELESIADVHDMIFIIYLTLVAIGLGMSIWNRYDITKLKGDAGIFYIHNGFTFQPIKYSISLIKLK